MPRSGRARGKRRRLRQRQRHARCSSSKGSVGKSSVTATPEGSSLKGSDSSDSALEDYMQNVASQLTDSAVNIEKDVVRKMSNLTFSSPAEPVEIGLSPSETASSLGSVSGRRLRKRERRKREWIESYELGNVAKRLRLKGCNSPLLSSSKSSLGGNGRAQVESEQDSSEHMDVGQSSTMFTDPCRREHHQCRTSADEVYADSGVMVTVSQLNLEDKTGADCDSSLSESDGDCSCDADDELSCLETPSVSSAPVFPWWDEHAPSKAGVYFGDREDTPTTSDQEFSDLVAATLSSLSSGARRGFQKRLVLAQNRNGGRAEFLEKEVDGYLVKLIDEFVADPSKRRLQLPPVPGRQRKKIYRLIELYNMKCQMRGNVATCVKTSETCSPSEAAVRAALQRSGRYTSPSQPQSRLNIHSGGVPISDSNVGNRMLRGMGWQPGTGLGASNKGILEPITVRKQFGRQGLG